MAAAADEPAKGKGSPLILTIVGLLVLTVLGGGGGWLLGTVVAPRIKAATAAIQATTTAAGDSKQAAAAAQANGIIALDPITTNLAYPSQSWIRLELALVFKGPPDVQLAQAIHQDILSYVRTVSLQQIEGARGLQYLRDDIQERVDLRSEGRVSKVMFRTFVIE
ncbi:flagellar basal body-associated FliL family protein [Rhizobium rhizogenes]|uniref:flagellar basal body-associated FliL family protein n=1 Tax=Rhizobium rhizogenes TaxID=359 RepID=UPI0015732CEC|nr:flagellar basal body-associated FliL family protein [Rhizobium rhizogenes]NTF40906.1 flagellar basal body-associated FliL family protein [Rhizobium rhizogenes]